MTFVGFEIFLIKNWPQKSF